MHALTFRLRKRLTHGIAAGATYTLSKSIDDASSIGGGGAVVAQNDQDLAAERGLSSFDQRHRCHRRLHLRAAVRREQALVQQRRGGGALRQLAAERQRVARIGHAVDGAGARRHPATSRAASTARCAPTTTAQPIASAIRRSALFFNTAAFSIPAPGTFGNAGRNTIIGPGTSVMNLGLTRNIAFGQTRGLSMQLLANNLFNTVQFASIDTDRQLADLRPGDRGPADAARAAADAVQVLIATIEPRRPRARRETAALCGPAIVAVALAVRDRRASRRRRRRRSRASGVSLRHRARSRQRRRPRQERRRGARADARRFHGRRGRQAADRSPASISRSSIKPSPAATAGFGAAGAIVLPHEAAAPASRRKR